MLFVLFHLGSERYALDASRVVEVVPLLALKRFPQSPRGVAGVFIYRGRPVPALDLCELTVGRPAQENFSTRIIIINTIFPLQTTPLTRGKPGEGGRGSMNFKHGNIPGESQLVGLIAERVTDTLRREESEFLDPGVRVATSPFFGPVLMDGAGVVQVINLEQLMAEGLAMLVSGQPLSALNSQSTSEALDATH